MRIPARQAPCLPAAWTLAAGAQPGTEGLRRSYPDGAHPSADLCCTAGMHGHLQSAAAAHLLIKFILKLVENNVCLLDSMSDQGDEQAVCQGLLVPLTLQQLQQQNFKY